MKNPLLLTMLLFFNFSSISIASLPPKQQAIPTQSQEQQIQQLQQTADQYNDYMNQQQSQSTQQYIQDNYQQHPDTSKQGLKQDDSAYTNCPNCPQG